MLKISGVLTVIALMSIPILLIISSKITTKSEKAYSKQMKLTGELNGYVEEYYNGHNVVSVFGKP